MKEGYPPASKHKQTHPCVLPCQQGHKNQKAISQRNAKVRHGHFYQASPIACAHTFKSPPPCAGHMHRLDQNYQDRSGSANNAFSPEKTPINRRSPKKKKKKRKQNARGRKLRNEQKTIRKKRENYYHEKQTAT